MRYKDFKIKYKISSLFPKRMSYMLYERVISSITFGLYCAK